MIVRCRRHHLQKNLRRMITFAHGIARWRMWRSAPVQSPTLPPMKNTLLTLVVLTIAGFIAAAIAHAAGYLQFNVLTPGGIAGTLVVAAVLVFAFSDYHRKPSFRVRRSARDDAPKFGLPTHIPAPDWTYHTRSN